ncbi:MAG TPA: phosphoribosylglycinamide formyltransferase, partial [Opitutae bacterium]|nr:phosphoribosylglycinamide formyltransferase [Opitutae bacterium]
MNTVILGSGKGSNAEAVLRAQAGQLLGNARVKAILADVPDAGILRIAQENGVESHSLEGGSFKTKLDERTEEIWIEKIRSLDPELIVLAGFMRVLKSPFLDAFGGRVINLHPSLLPSFKGLNAINRAFD